MLPILWQQHLVPNGEELSLDPQVGRRARVEAALDLSVQRRVDREGGDADDVQELRADRVLQLPLVVLVGEPTHRSHRAERHRGEKAGELDAEPLPGP